MPEPNRIRPTMSSGWRMLLAIIRQMQVDEDQAGEPDGNVDEEDDAPVQVPDDEAAGDAARAWGRSAPGMATKLMARISSDLANVRTRVSRPTGTIMAPPQPCRMRQATSRWMSLRDAAQERAQR